MQRLTTALILCAICLAPLARADLQLDSVGLLEADSVKKFSGMRQHGILLRYGVSSRFTGRWVPDSLDLTAGRMERGRDSAPYLSFGPTYRFEIKEDKPGRWFVDFGVHPMYVSRSDFGGKDFGGKVFFTSFLGVGAYLDRQRKTSFLLRYQHTSNAGISDANPGVDMLALSLSYRFGRDHRNLHRSPTGW